MGIMAFLLFLEGRNGCRVRGISGEKVFIRVGGRQISSEIRYFSTSRMKSDW